MPLCCCSTSPVRLHSTPKLAQMISGDSPSTSFISIVRHDTTMLLNADAQKYRFWSFFQQFLIGNSAKSIRRRSRPQCTAAPGFTMSCTKITSMRSSAIRAAKTTAASRKCSSATQSSTRCGDITMRWKSYYYAIPKRDPPLAIAHVRYEHAHVPLHGLRSLEMWYSALREYAAPLKKTDTAYKEVRGLHISISPSRSAAAKASQRISATISKF